VVEHLLCKCKALSLNSSLTKKKNWDEPQNSQLQGACRSSLSIFRVA
jgi:hypothetical protein